MDNTHRNELSRPVGGVYNRERAGAMLTHEQSPAEGVRDNKPTLIAIVASVLLFASLLSPQIGFLGRGLRLSLPAFALLVVFTILSYKPKDVAYSIFHNKYGLPVLCGLLFVFMGFMRNSADPRPDEFQNHIINSLITIMFFVSIVIVKHAIPRALEAVRWLTLIITGFSLSIAIPAMVANPGVMRDLQKLRAADPNASTVATYVFQGVADYAIYYAVAIGWPIIAHWLYRQPRSLLKSVGWIALLGASVTVFLSSLTLPALLLLGGMAAWFLVRIIQSKQQTFKFVTFIAISVLIPLMPTIIESGKEFEATSFITSKAIRIFEGVSEYGIIEGDPTGRGTMLEGSARSFAVSPLFGSWGFVADFYIGGHSSWLDSLVLYGVVGTLFYLAYLLPAWIRKSPFSLSEGMAGGTISWILCLFAGTLNTTFFFAAILVPLWLYDDHYP